MDKDDAVLSSTTDDATKTADTPAPTMEDSIRTRFRELTGVKTDEPAANEPGEEPAAEIEEKPVAAAKTVRDAATGKFTKQAAESATEEPAAEVEEPVVEEPAEEAATEPVVAPVPTKFAKPPSSYSPAETADWEKTPETVRAAIHRREEDMHRGLGSYKQLADIGKLFDTEFRPYEAMIRSAGTTAPQLVRNWLNTEYQLQTATPQKKAEIFAQYAKAYGIDMEAAATAYQSGPAATPPPDPTVENLRKEVLDLRTSREKEIQEAQQREQDSVRKEVEAFATSPGHEHYDTVKLDMAALLKEGRAQTLQEAYDNAMYANPTTRKILETKQLEANRAKAAEKAAAAKKAASTNVAKRGTPPAKPVVGTMDDTLRAKFRELTGTAG